MKHQTSRILFGLLASILIFSFGCGQSESNGGGNANEPVATVSPSPKSSPTPDNQPRSGGLIDATSSGDVSYRLEGIDSTSMNLRVQNKSERVWELKVEVGTKLEPDDSGVQRMVVTKELEVHLEPHDEQKLEVEASCLDISKAAPAESDKSWQIKKSDTLAQFIKCANNAIDSTQSDDERAGILQFAIWQARGATHDQWIHFWTDKDLSTDEAEQKINEYASLVRRVTSGCGSLTGI
jgi:hypothetical protein